MELRPVTKYTVHEMQIKWENFQNLVFELSLRTIANTNTIRILYMYEYCKIYILREIELKQQSDVVTV